MKLRNLILITLISIGKSNADIVFQFKDPAFSGQGWAAHALTVDQQEKNARASIESKRQAEINQAKIDAQNTPLAKFMNLFESQVYAQLATQLSNNLFAEGSSNTGSFSLGGNTISYIKTNTDVQLTVVDASGNITKVNVPISQFKF